MHTQVYIGLKPEKYTCSAFAPLNALKVNTHNSQTYVDIPLYRLLVLIWGPFSHPIVEMRRGLNVKAYEGIRRALKFVETGFVFDHFSFNRDN